VSLKVVKGEVVSWTRERYWNRDKIIRKKVDDIKKVLHDNSFGTFNEPRFIKVRELEAKKRKLLNGQEVKCKLKS